MPQEPATSGSFARGSIEYNIDGLKGWKLPRVNNDNFGQICRQFRVEAEHLAVQLLIRASKRSKLYSVAFNEATKLKLSHLLEQMRETVDKLEMPTGKKDRLFKKLSDLQLEIDRDRTRLETYGALVIEVFAYGGEAVKQLEPLVQYAERIGRAFGLSKRDEDDQLRLLTSQERRRIEPPKDRAASIGDEIPF